MELSIAAKAYYVLNRLNAKATLEDIAAMLPKFGWSVSAEQLREGDGVPCQSEPHYEKPGSQGRIGTRAGHSELFECT
jgi:hypothetical protein